LLPLVVLASAAAMGALHSGPVAQPVVANGLRIAADTDSIIKAKVAQLVMPPMPVPPAITPFTLQACFDVDTAGRGRLLLWTRTSDSSYNRRVLETLNGYSFIPSRWSGGAALRDTVCVRAVAGNR
jgi:hypothetical protein